MRKYISYAVKISIGILMFFFLFVGINCLGSQYLKQSVVGNWYSIDNDESSWETLVVSDDLFFKKKSSFAKVIPQAGYLKCISANCMLYYVDDMDASIKFKVKFNQDRSKMILISSGNSYTIREVWKRGVPSKKQLSEVAKNVAEKENIEEDEAAKINALFSDRRSSCGDLAVVNSWCNVGKNIHFKFKIYNRSNQTVDNVRLHIDIFKGYSNQVSDYECSVGPVYSNGITELEVEGGWPNPTIYGDNKFDIHCKVHIIDYELYD